MQNYKTALGTEQTQAPAPQSIYITSGGSAIVVIAMLLFSIIILYTTNRNEDSAPYGVIGSVAFFMIGTPVGLLAVNGGLAQMFGDYQREKTIRCRDQQQATLQAAYDERITAHVVPPMQIERREPVAPLQQTGFVSAIPRVADNVKVDAASYVRQLFDSNGQPLPNKITRNKRQIQHQSPAPEAVEYLMSLGIVHRGEGKQLYYNLDDYPTLRDGINSIGTGVKKPSYQGGERVGEGRV